MCRPAFLAFALATSSSAFASPIARSDNTVRSNGADVRLGEHSENRTVVVVMCIALTFLLALTQGYRAGRIAGSRSETKVSDVLVFAQGFISTVFILAVGVKTAGLGMSTDEQCRGAIWICIVLYGAAKIVLYLFLLERIHIVRAPFVDRRHDLMYLIGAITTVSGYVGIIGYESKNPLGELSRETGLCRIGVQPSAAIAIIVFDTAINVVLTVLFVWQLRPATETIPSHSLWYTNSKPGEQRLSMRSVCCVWTSDGWRARMRNNMRLMLVRNVIGSSLLLMIAAANNIAFLVWPSAKKSHACLLMCMSDVALCMLITNWLTMRYPKDDHESTRASFASPDPMDDRTIDLYHVHTQQTPLPRLIRCVNNAPRLKEGHPSINITGKNV